MALKSMPLMPDFDVNFNPDEDEEEDAAEEKNLMTILLKLKNAKSSLAATRKRCDIKHTHRYHLPHC